MLKITNSFDEINEADNAVVYFTAEWCGPCKQLKPQYGKASVSDQDIDYFMVDVDKIPSEIVNLYEIKSIPQVFVMKKGKIVKKINSRTSDAIIEEVHQENQGK